jgi:hypothetical protein
MENFTDIQLIKLQERLTICENLNTKVGSNSKIEDLKMFVDELNNIFISFVSITSVGEKEYKKLYLEFNRDGQETLLNRSGFSTDELEMMFSNLKPLKITEE